ncbi:Calx-beta domain-containing protein, partial [Pedobacter borealis]|uniref:Calx-beta domain-containing protein n=1 Tax=Pedobacter borealis TaxID=475254 RepID=UPI0004939087
MNNFSFNALVFTLDFLAYKKNCGRYAKLIIWSLLLTLCCGKQALAQSPGGVATGLVSWNSADNPLNVGTTTSITSLTDKVPVVPARVWTSLSGARTINPSGINFNPSIIFPGGGGNYFNTTTFLDALTAGEVFCVQFSSLPNTSTTPQYPFEFGGTNPNPPTSSTVSTYTSSTNSHFTYFGSTTRQGFTYPTTSPTYPTTVNVLNAHLLNIWSATNDWAAGIDGRVVASTLTNVVNFVTPVPPAASTRGNYIGAGHGSLFNGQLAEIMIFSQKLSNIDRQQVQSYLALKYGLTLGIGTPIDYLASDGTTKMWTASNNIGYAKHITGIGRDNAIDGSVLNQKQSLSADTGIVTLALGSTVATSNAANTATITNNLSFLTFGDNGATTPYRTPVAGVTGVNSRMARVWKAQKNNWADQNITLKLTGGNALIYLLVSTDDTFGTGDVAYALDATGSVTLSSSLLPDGAYFTFAKTVKGPNTVSTGLTFWLRADDGVSTLNQWNDYSTNGNHAIQNTAVNQPSINAQGLNFNYSRNFNGNTNITSSSYMDITTARIDPSTATVFAVGSPGTNFTSGPIARELVSSGSGQSLSDQGTEFRLVGNNLDYLESTGQFPTQKGSITGVKAYVANQSYVFSATQTDATNGVSLFQNNVFDKQGNILFTPNTANFTSIGIRSFGGRQFPWLGQIGEVIVYDRVLSDTERQTVESYLSLKYGITMNAGGSNYLGSDGAAYWTTTAANGIYKNNIVGIGRDDATDFNTKQSRSVNTGAILTVGLGTIAASNVANTNTFALDKSFFVLGSNSAELTTITTDIPVGSCISQRLSQEWEAQLTNFDATTHPLRLQFDLTGVSQTGSALSDYKLLIDLDGDGNFATGTVTQISATDLNAGVVGFSNVTALTNGVVFTLATGFPPARPPVLVADGTVKTVVSTCIDGNTIYFLDPADAGKYIAAIDLNGNTLDVTKLSGLIDVNRDMITALGKNSGTTYGTQLMRRLLQITYTGPALTVNGGVKVRLFWNPAERTNAETTLSGSRGVTGVQKWIWFKHTGDIATTLADLSPEKLANITELTPSATGQANGVDYVEFSGIQSFSTFGGLTTATQILSIAKVQDGTEGATNGSFSISLPAGVLATENVTVNYTISGTATNGVDYTTLSTTAIIPAGGNSVTIPVTVTDDNLIEITEGVTVTLTGGTGTTSGAYQVNSTAANATVNITDNDNTPANRTLSVVSTAANGAEPSTNGNFSINLPPGITASEDITVNYTIGGMATNGTDYASLGGTVTIAAGQNAVDVPVMVTDDQLIENPETVILTLTNGTSASFAFTASTTAGNATVNIADDDNTPANRTLSVVKTADGAEPSTDGSFTISLPAGILTTEPITVNYTIGGTATNGSDYITLGGTALIVAGQNSITVPVRVTDDQLIEGGETVILSVTNGTSPSFAYTASTTAGNATVDITDNDNTPANLTLSVVRTADGAEPSTNGSFSISLPTGITATEDVTVNYTIGGTATAGSDYAALGTVTIPAGQNSVDVAVTVINDQLIENTETVILTLNSGTSASFAYTASTTAGNATVNIADNDNTPENRTLSVVKTADGAEPSTNGSFTISLPAGVLTTEPITVNYTIGGTATANSDYTALSGTATIAAGQNSISVPVTVINDQLIENNETVVLTLTGGTSANFTYSLSTTEGNATVNIADDDNTPSNLTLSVVATTPNGAEPSNNGSFRISLPSGITATEDITVNYSINGTATNGTDYAPLGGTVTIAAGQNSVNVPVMVTDDQLIENTETVVLTLTSGSSTNFSYSASSINTATVNIADNDNTPANRTLSVVKTADGAEPSTDGSFTISLPAGVLTTEPITVNYTIGGTATNGSDYITLGGTALIVAGQNSITVPVRVTDDQLIEGGETVILSVTNGTSPSGSDYAALGTVTIPAGQNSVDVAVTVINDQLIENTETVILTLNSGTSASFAYTASTTAGSATVNITDNDNTSANRTLSVVKTADGAEPSSNGSFSISLPAGVLTTEPITVNYTIGGTATSGTDYTALSGTVIIPAGQNSVNIPVQVIDDTSIEPSETVIMNISGGSDGQFTYTVASGAGSATVNIADNDIATSSTLVLVTKVSDAMEGGVNGQYRIGLPPGVTSSEPVTVNYTISGTATNSIDYTTLSGTVVIPAGANEVFIDVDALTDAVVEGPESVVLTLNSASSISYPFAIDPSSSSATVNIIDANGANSTLLQVVKISDGSEPATNGRFRVHLAGGATSNFDITVGYSLSGTATAGVDYQGLGTIVIPANTNGVDIDLNVLDDQFIEPTETMIFNLISGSASDGTNAYVFPADQASSQVTINIADDDNTTTNRVLSVVKTNDAGEPSTHGAYTISLPAGYSSSSAITVNYTMSGTATNGTDYTIGTVTLPAYANSVTVPLTVTDNQLIENTETAILTLTSGTSAGFAYTPSGTNGAATMNITDDDNTPANRTLSVVRTADGGEPSTNGGFSISLPTGIISTEAITVGYTIGGTATGGSDYTTLNGTVVIPAGQNSVSVPVTVMDDQLIERTETIILTLTDGASASFAYTPSTTSGAATVNITDDDNTPANRTLSIVRTADGGEPSTNGGVNINLPTGILATEDITVNYTISGTATNGADYITLDGTAIIAAGQNSVSVPVMVTDDQLIENTEMVTLTLTGGTSVSFAYTPSTTSGVATVNITDDDNTPANLTLSVVKMADGEEPSANGSFRISLPTGITATEAITVNYTIGGTATANSDYTALSGSAIIANGQNSVSVPVQVIDDQLIENNETVVLSLTNGVSTSFSYSASTTNGAATVNIADNDNTPANRTLSVVKTADGAEPSSNGSFSISLPTGITATEAITVNYTIGGTATANSDYTALTGTTTIAAGQNSVSIPVTVTNDQLIENNETVVLTLTSGASTNFSYSLSTTNRTATVNIADDDNTPSNLTLSVAKTADGAEPSNNGGFNISLPTGITATEAITVNYSIGGTATDGSDYALLNGTVIIPAGENSVLVPVTVTDDQLIENTETVELTLISGSSTSFSYAASSANKATVSITDNDNTLANLTLSVVKTADGAEPSTNGSFTISLPPGVLTTEAITVNYTVGGTATNGTDYITLDGMVIIPAGQSSVLVPVRVTDDLLIENPERVILTVINGISTNFSYTPSATNTATVNIADNDSTPANLTLSVVKASDGSEPSANGSFSISLPTGVRATENITVNYTIGGTATNGADYATLGGTVTIPAGQNSVSVPVIILDDQLIENTENVVLTLTNGTSTSFTFTPSATAGNATVNIADNDNTPANRTLSIVKTADGEEPSTNGSFTISLPTGITATEAIVVNYTIGGTAANGVDYTTLGTTATIAAGQNSVLVSVPIIDDQLIENTETVILTLTNGASASFAYTASATAGNATVNISDNDNTPANLELSVVKTADGAEPATNGSFSISLPTGIMATEAITVNYTIGGTAANGVDYATIGSTVTIPAGQNSVSIPVTVTDDQLIENVETVNLRLNGGTSTSFTFRASAANGAATVNIIDNENTPANRTLSVVKTADGAEPSTNGSFSISLPAGVLATEDVTVNYTISGTATNGVDYTSLGGMAIIPAGQNSVSVPVTVTDDQKIEGTETVILNLSNGVSANFAFTASATAGSATLNITDNDNTATNLTLSVVKTSDAAEPGTNGIFTLSLPSGITASTDVTVSYTVGGTATSGTDYSALSGTAVIPAGQNSVTIPVQVIDNTIIEPTETVIMNISGGNDGQFAYTVVSGAGSATANITDNDITVSNKLVLVTKVSDAIEGGTGGQFRISLPPGVISSEDVVINFTIGGTATFNTDYSLTGVTGSTVTIPAGSNEVFINVNAGNDGTVEGSESVIVTLTSANSASYPFTIDPSNSSTTATIIDVNGASSTPLQVVKVSDGSEPANNGHFTIQLAGGATSAYPITVGYKVSGTATAGLDYQGLGTIVIPANTNSIDIDLNVLDDQFIEPTETMIFDLISGSAYDGVNGTALVFPTDPAFNQVTINIADDDNTDANRILSVQKTNDAGEPTTHGTYTIKLPNAYSSSTNITVSYVMSGTATSGTDYTIGTITIPAYTNSVTVPLTVINDEIIEGPEQATLTITNSTDANGFVYLPDATINGAVLTIADDDNTANNNVLFVTNAANAAEPATNGSLRISLPVGVTSNEAITVNYTVGGSATSRTDYVALSGTVIIPAGQNSVNVPVTVIDDQNIEILETVVLTATRGNSNSFSFGPAPGNAVATVNLADDDSNSANQVLSIVKKTDAAEPSTAGSFTVKLPTNITAAEPINVSYTIAGTAVNGGDYVSLSGNVIIPAGSNSVDIPVTVINDQLIEDNETVIVTLSGGVSPSFVFTVDGAANSATVDIADDDNIPANRVLALTKVSDGAEPSTNGAFRVSLPPNITAIAPVTVNYTISGTATAGSDYATLSGTTV